MAADEKKTLKLTARDTLSRREFLAFSAAAGATILMPGFVSAAPAGAKTFTIMHTNDLHSNFLGLGPAADYTPFTLNDDATRGGYARQAALIAKRRQARKARLLAVGTGIQGALIRSLPLAAHHAAGPMPRQDLVDLVRFRATIRA